MRYGWTDNPVREREDRQKLLGCLRLGLAVWSLLAALAAGALVLSELPWLTPAGLVLLALATAAPPGLLVVASLAADRATGLLDELQATGLTMTEVMRGKLAASADACLPGFGISFLLAVGLHASGAGLYAVCLLLLLAATTAWCMAWSVRCGLWAVGWPTWAVLAAYGALPLVLASVAMWVLAATQRFSPSGGTEAPMALAWLSVSYIAAAGLAWLVHWNTVNRFDW